MKTLPSKAALFIGTFALLSLALIVKDVLAGGAVYDYGQFAAYLLVASFAARFRLSLPRMTSSMAVNLPFILIAVIELNLLQALTIAGVSTFVQCFWPESKKRNPMQLMFNVAVLVVSAHLAWMASRFGFSNAALRVAASGMVILLANTIPVATIIALSEQKRVSATWMQIVQLTFPYYLVAAGLAALVKLANHAVGWQVPLFVLPATLLMYRSFSTYFRQMSQVPPSAKAMAASTS